MCCFVAAHAGTTSRADRRGLTLFLCVYVLALLRHASDSSASELVVGAVICASLSALLALLALAPRAYARCRRPAIAYVRILLSGVAVLAVDLPRMLPGDVAEVAARSGVQAWLHFAFCTLVCSGASHLVNVAVGVPLPPLEHVATQLASAAVVAGANTRLCTSEFSLHPHTAARMATAYTWLGPLIVYVEPLLLLAGVRPGHPHLKCHAGEAQGPATTPGRAATAAHAHPPIAPPCSRGRRAVVGWRGASDCPGPHRPGQILSGAHA